MDELIDQILIHCDGREGIANSLSLDYVRGLQGSALHRTAPTDEVHVYRAR